MNSIFKNKYLALTVLALFYVVSMSCRYTIREIGFANLSDVNYRLYLFNTKWNESEEQKLKAVFSSSNVTPFFVNAKQLTEYEKGLQQHYKTKHQYAVFVNQDGTHFKINFENKQGLLNYFSSPLLSELPEHLIHHFAVVLVAGNSTDGQCRNKVKDQIQEFTKIQSQLPKPIKQGPIMLELDLSKEPLLKKFFGFQPEQFQSVILYGKGRVFAEPFGQQELEDSLLFKYLNLVGSDCECGLSKSWMTGERIPQFWSKAHKAKLFKKLKFDVEDPMVKSEMSQIISKQADTKMTMENVDLFQPNTINLDEEFDQQEEKPKSNKMWLWSILALLIGLVVSWLVMKKVN